MPLRIALIYLTSIATRIRHLFNQIPTNKLVATSLILIVGISSYAYFSRLEANRNLGHALAEKAIRSFDVQEINSGRIYAAHALSLLDKTKDNELAAELIGYRLAHHLWDMKKGNHTIRLKKHDDLGDGSMVTKVLFSPNGQMIASQIFGNSILLWNALSGKTIAAMEGSTFGKNPGTTFSNNFSFSPDGKILATPDKNNIIRLVETGTGRIVAHLGNKKITKIEYLDDYIYEIEFSPTGNALASVSYNPADQLHVIRIWDVASKKSIGTLKGHTKHIERIIVSSDGQKLLSVSKDKTIRLWDIASGVNTAILERHEELLDIRFSADSKTFALFIDDKAMQLFDVTNGQAITSLKESKMNIRTFFKSDEITFSVKAQWPEIILWDMEIGKSVLRIPITKIDTGKFTLSPDGRLAASAGRERDIVRLWNMRSGKCIAIFKGHTSSVTSVNFSPDGKTLASSSHDGTVRLWPMPEEELGISDWRSQAVKDEARYNLKLLGMNLVPWVVPDRSFNPNVFRTFLRLPQNKDD